MFRQILYTRWKAARWAILPLVLAAVAIPIVMVRRLGPVGGEPAPVGMTLEWVSLWSPLLPILAAATGIIVGLLAWSWDHREEHVYALSLPLPRSSYVLLKLGAGALLVAVPAAALWGGGHLATASVVLPEGLHAYPGMVAARFLLAALLAYSVAFALASGTIRITVTLIVVLVGGLVMAGVGVDFAENFFPALARWNPVEWMVKTLAEWPGPFHVFVGNWFLIDV